MIFPKAVNEYIDVLRETGCGCKRIDMSFQQVPIPNIYSHLHSGQSFLVSAQRYFVGCSYQQFHIGVPNEQRKSSCPEHPVPGLDEQNPCDQSNCSVWDSFWIRVATAPSTRPPAHAARPGTVIGHPRLRSHGGTRTMARAHSEDI